MVKRTILTVAVLTSCGYTAKDNEMVGQVKKITNQTPIICTDYIEADISLGVIRNGVGSMSGEDVEAMIMSSDQEKILKDAAEAGKLVKVKYNTVRFPICWPAKRITSVEVVN